MRILKNEMNLLDKELRILSLMSDEEKYRRNKISKLSGIGYSSVGSTIKNLIGREFIEKNYDGEYPTYQITELGEKTIKKVVYVD